MSLVKNALDKLREKSAATPGISQHVVASAAPAARVVREPKLLLTASMREALGLAAPPAQEHQRNSEYRQIKRHVMAELRADSAGRVVLVASALAGEGKSFTAANLARSLALDPDYTVLLVDADVIKPQLTRALGLLGTPGLADALVDDAIDPELLVITTDLEGLSVLPAGSGHEHATEYFSSERMRQLLGTLLAVPNRIVLIDSLPLLLTTEATALVPHASQLLLVVRAESTPQSAVEQALELIGEGVNVKLVLNAVVRTKAGRYLGYGYGFDYSYTPRNDERSGRS